jgi:hypothetical protein
MLQNPYPQTQNNPWGADQNQGQYNAPPPNYNQPQQQQQNWQQQQNPQNQWSRPASPVSQGQGLSYVPPGYEVNVRQSSEGLPGMDVEVRQVSPNQQQIMFGGGGNNQTWDASRGVKRQLNDR